MSDVISRQVAISAICSACGKIDCDKMDKCEKLQLPPANCSEFPNSSDTISRQQAIEALKNDMASLDHIIKGMSANDVRLDAYVSQRNQVNYDIYTINNLPPVQPEQLGTNLAEVGTDCISRQADVEPLQPWEVLAAQAVLSQPEIIRCKDCRHRDKFGCCKYWVGLTMGMPTTATDDDDFCSHAERSKT